ncbi:MULTISPECIES: hypothetical protein [Bacillus]|uniref:hypothetical protein n=1 Tax=Bacillus TaxID=1386 RepID=UPI0012F7E57E|nr:MULTISPECIES: hypothetical protein [Bacillus]MCY7580641.1 hypothetical protein [Bacillus altitudinis]MCY7595891.1 hypothetical protein [Bacillus altitudinis]QGX63957.1 hypothetical protein GPA07_00135 [Bacillus sp. ms-22]
MFYQINHPKMVIPKWSQVDASSLDILLEKFMLRERMVQDSIRLLKDHKKPKVLNLGGFRIKIEDTKEEALVIKSLEYVLRNYSDKKHN